MSLLFLILSFFLLLMLCCSLGNNSHRLLSLHPPAPLPLRFFLLSLFNVLNFNIFLQNDFPHSDP